MRYRRDEGRPLGAGLQGQAPNHLKLLWSKARVVSVKGKGAGEPRQVWIRKTNEIEPLMTYRKHRDDVKTREGLSPGMNPRETCLLLGWRPV